MRGSHLDAIGWTLLDRRDQRLENVVLATRQLGDEGAVAGQGAHGDRFRRKDPDGPSRRSPMRPKHRERIGIARSSDRVEVLLPRSPVLPQNFLHGWRSAYRHEGSTPDFLCIFGYRSIGGEPADIGRVQTARPT